MPQLQGGETGAPSCVDQRARERPLHFLQPLIWEQRHYFIKGDNKGIEMIHHKNTKSTKEAS
jgi:hypothetical protein